METPDNNDNNDNNPDSTWAPQSPDLSAYHSAADFEPVHPQHKGYRGSISHTSPPTTSFAAPYTAPFSPPASSPIAPNKAAFMPRGVRKVQPQPSSDASPLETPLPAKRGRKAAASASANPGNGALIAPVAEASSSVLEPDTETPVEVKTKFPVARIKRIMQADDDVGKVAQVTPVVVSKALELFMISLVTKAAAEAKARSSKRVTAVHLKAAVEKDEQFDFLSEIVSKIADAPAAGDKNEGDPMDVDGKKRKGAGRKKKKASSDEDM